MKKKNVFHQKIYKKNVWQTNLDDKNIILKPMCEENLCNNEKVWLKIIVTLILFCWKKIIWLNILRHKKYQKKNLVEEHYLVCNILCSNQNFYKYLFVNKLNFAT